MDWQTLFNIAGATVSGALGWFANAIYQSVKTLEHDLSAHKVEVARDYVTNRELRDIDSKLDRIIEKLDRKQDK